MSPLRISLVSFFFALVYASIVSFVSVYAEELQLTEMASYFFIVYVIALLISRPFTGKWFDQYGANVIMIPSIISFALGMFLLSQAERCVFIPIVCSLYRSRLGNNFPIRTNDCDSSGSAGIEKVLPQLLSCQPWIRVLGSDRLSLELSVHNLDTVPYISIARSLSLQV